MTTPIQHFADPQVYTVEIPGVETVGADGYPVGGVATTFEIVATVQPTSGKTWASLSEGERQMDSRTIWSESELRTVEQQTGAPAYRISIDGSWYKLTRIQRWDRIFRHWQAVALREGP